MKIFQYELKFYRKALIMWCISMIVLVFLSMVKYNMFSGAGQSAADLFAQLPQSIQTIFGLNGFNLTQASGFFGIMFMYIALMATIHAAMLGAGIISKEERDKTSEFLFAKPISRLKVTTFKILAGLVNIVIFNLVTLASSIITVEYFTKSSSTDRYIILLMCGLIMMQIIFFFIGTAVAASVKKPKTASSVATGVLLGTFILTYFINMNSSFDSLKYLTPFKYFDAQTLLASGKLDIIYVLISIILIFICTVVTYLAYKNKDLK